MKDAHHGGASLAGEVRFAIVLSSGIEPDQVLDYASRSRVSAGVGLLQEGRVAKLILSGGFVSDQQASLAEAMRDYALELGASSEDLILESRARTTLENLEFSFPMTQAEDREIALITDDYHLTRAAMLARLFGRADVQLIASNNVLTWRDRTHLTFLIREAMAWWFNLGKAALFIGLDAAGLSAEERRAYVF
ncbi:MAG: YdcF family protein [Pseudomonadota bacterium]